MEIAELGFRPPLMEDLLMYAVYAAYDAVVLIPLGALMWFAVKRCNRVC